MHFLIFCIGDRSTSGINGKGGTHYRRGAPVQTSDF